MDVGCGDFEKTTVRRATWLDGWLSAQLFVINLQEGKASQCNAATGVRTAVQGSDELAKLHPLETRRHIIRTVPKQNRSIHMCDNMTTIKFYSMEDDHIAHTRRQNLLLLWRTKAQRPNYDSACVPKECSKKYGEKDQLTMARCTNLEFWVQTPIP